MTTGTVGVQGATPNTKLTLSAVDDGQLLPEDALTADIIELELVRQERALEAGDELRYRQSTDRLIAFVWGPPA